MGAVDQPEGRLKKDILDLQERLIEKAYKTWLKDTATATQHHGGWDLEPDVGLSPSS